MRYADGRTTSVPRAADSSLDGGAIVEAARKADAIHLEGISTLVPFHRLMVTDERFRAGEHTTDYLDTHLGREAVERAVEKRGSDPPTGGSGADESGRTERTSTVEVDDQRFEVESEAPEERPETGTERPSAVEPDRPDARATGPDESATKSTPATSSACWRR